MRPGRFAGMLADAVNREGHLSAVTYADAGITRSLWGIVATGNGIRVDVQVVARSAPGDDYAVAERRVTGPEHPPLTGAASDSLPGLELHLAALAVEYAPTEIRSVDLYSQRGKPQAILHGATITFHDGSAVFMYVTGKGKAP